MMMRTLSRPWYRIGRVVTLSVALGSPWTFGTIAAFAQGSFQIEKATIGDIHQAIQQGDTTCLQVVQGYVERAKAYNGICTQLVTADGGRIAPGQGAVRAGAPFSSTTVPVSEVLPDYDDYVGAPIEFGRMEATRSDPAFNSSVWVDREGREETVPDLGRASRPTDRRSIKHLFSGTERAPGRGSFFLMIWRVVQAKV